MCRYGLSKEKISALDITTEPICELAVFDAPGFVVEVQQQFATVSEESLFVLTAEMAEEYIRRAAEFCIKEMEKTDWTVLRMHGRNRKITCTKKGQRHVNTNQTIMIQS